MSEEFAELLEYLALQTEVVAIPRKMMPPSRLTSERFLGPSKSYIVLPDDWIGQEKGKCLIFPLTDDNKHFIGMSREQVRQWANTAAH